MIVMTFTIELDIGLSCLLQAALPLASDRSRDEDSSSWAWRPVRRADRLGVHFASTLWFRS